MSGWFQIKTVADRRQKSPAYKPAFTLMEMLIVLVILGMVTGMTTLQFGSYTTQRRLKNSAKMVAGLVQRTQLLNMSSGTSSIIDDQELVGVYENMAAADAAGGASDRKVNTNTVVYKVIEPIKIGSDGSCSKGLISFSLQDFSYALAVSAPLCESQINRLK